MSTMRTHRILAQPARKDSAEPSMTRSTSPDIVEKYLTDESAILKGKAEEVVFPETENHVASLLKEANDRKIPVTVSGAGTGITGSRVPMGGIVLSTERMIRVFKQDSRPLTVFKDPVGNVDYQMHVFKNEHCAIVPVGISVENLHKAVGQSGLCYPPDPTEKTAFIGGTVATNASGAKTFHYGPTRNWVRRVRVVLPNGDVLDIRRGEILANDRNEFEIVLTTGERRTVRTPSYTMPTVKNAAGYFAEREMDLIDLFIGAEGTLGVFTEIEVLLVDNPGQVFDCLAFFPTTSDAVGFCDTARTVARSAEGTADLSLVKPLSLEFFDRCSLDFQKKKHPDVPPNAKAAILFEQVVAQDKLYECLSQWNSLFERYHVAASWLPMDQRDRERLTEFRHSLPESINDYVRSKGTQKVATDIAVPADRFSEMMRFHEETGLEMQIERVMEDLNLKCDRERFDRFSLSEKVKFVEDQAKDLGYSQSSDLQPKTREETYDSLADRMDAVRQFSRTEVAYAIFGHIGDYHLHFNFLPKSSVELQEMKKRAIGFAKRAVELGGTITAEHGVGKKSYKEEDVEKSYLEIMYGRGGLESIAAIKNVLDPNWILNCGNVVSQNYLRQVQRAA